ncbi:DUF4064 domain-containing protein [Phytohabitans sp. ZYX-F-186]|uniref:DUF4064 domain-containing protein n=1 Tax=Phytohabitans maris TaxID=3071409 RepID=A0ABU0ZVU3_9ACTN|nr:DUF4064 domain-containing protein [Phytohabitans sp. ZYX-F-186]MDQ7910325.1 DUF4064 domain-containing protein [Phytohabitans sp. ZYX-F-186]
MADPTSPAVPARPATVNISSYLLYLYAALGVIGVIIGLSVIGTTSDVYREAYEGTSAEGTEGFVTVTSIVVAVISLLFAAAFVVLAIFNNRGKNASRIVTWVLGGVSLCCSGVSLAGSALTNSMNFDTGDSDVPDAAEIQRRLEDALPSWYTPVSITVAVLSLLALLVALILLALPPSNEFFRKPAPLWEPPVPGAAYPGYPPATAAPAPGVPPAPGTPPAPPAPGASPYAPPPVSGAPEAAPPPAAGAPESPGEDKKDNPNSPPGQ